MLQKVKKGDLALGAATRMFPAKISFAPWSDASDVAIGDLGLKGLRLEVWGLPVRSRAVVLGNWV
jgi:hypothetical protein